MKSVIASFVLFLLLGAFPSFALPPTLAEVDEAIETLVKNHPNLHGYQLALRLLESTDAQTLQSVSFQKHNFELNSSALGDILAHTGARLSPAQRLELRAVADSWYNPHEHYAWIDFVKSFGGKDDIPKLKSLLGSSMQRAAFEALVEIAPIEELKVIALQFPKTVPENDRKLISRPQAEAIIRSIEVGPPIPAAPFRLSLVCSLSQALLATSGEEHQILCSLQVELSVPAGWSIFEKGVKDAGAGAVESLMRRLPLHYELENMVIPMMRRIAENPTSLSADEAEQFRRLAKKLEQRPSPTASIYLMFSRQ